MLVSFRECIPLGKRKEQLMVIYPKLQSSQKRQRHGPMKVYDRQVRSLRQLPWRSSGDFTSNWAMKKNPGWLFNIGDEILPSYMGIVRSQYKDPY